MQEANTGNLFEEILLLIAIYFIIRFLARLFLPVVAKKVVEKAGEQFRKQQEEYQNKNTNFQTPKSDKPRETKKVGEYIDYEEIE